MLHAIPGQNPWTPKPWGSQPRKLVARESFVSGSLSSVLSGANAGAGSWPRLCRRGGGEDGGGKERGQKELPPLPRLLP